MTAISDAKRELRAEARRRRPLLARRAGADAGERLRDAFLEAMEPAPGSAVSGYWPLADEMDPRPLMNALIGRGCTCLLPVMRPADVTLIFRQWRPGDALESAALGIQEPRPERPARRPDLLLVPLLAFDGRGERLGGGAGYYDRALGALRADGGPRPEAIGIAFSGQWVDSVPHDRFDQRLDWVVTEGGAIRFD